MYKIIYFNLIGDWWICPHNGNFKTIILKHIKTNRHLKGFLLVIVNGQASSPNSPLFSFFFSARPYDCDGSQWPPVLPKIIAYWLLLLGIMLHTVARISVCLFTSVSNQCQGMCTFAFVTNYCLRHCECDDHIGYSSLKYLFLLAARISLQDYY